MSSSIRNCLKFKQNIRKTVKKENEKSWIENRVRANVQCGQTKKKLSKKSENIETFTIECLW